MCTSDSYEEMTVGSDVARSKDRSSGGKTTHKKDGDQRSRRLHQEMGDVSSKYQETRVEYAKSAREICGDVYYKEFMKNFLLLLKERVNGEMFKFLYSNYSAPGVTSGETLWDDTICWGHESGYYIPFGEAALIRKNRNWLATVFQGIDPYGVILGPGPQWSRMYKEVPFFRAVRASGVTAIDLNVRYALGAEQDIKLNLGVPARSIVGDFTNPNLGDIGAPEDKPIIATMFGSTVTQFALNETEAGNAVPLCSFFNNLRSLTKNRAFILMSIDANRAHDKVLDCYRGRHFSGWQNQFWNFAAYMVGDSRFSPKSISYAPYVDEETHSLVHMHRVEENCCIECAGKRYILTEGTKLVLGESRKWLTKDVDPIAARCGYEPLAVLEAGGTVQAVLYMDQGMPAGVAAPVRKALQNIRKAGGGGNSRIVL